MINGNATIKYEHLEEIKKLTQEANLGQQKQQQQQQE